MKGGYQILDLKGVNLFELNGTTKVIKLTKEQQKGILSGKVLLLNNVNYDDEIISSAYACFDPADNVIVLLHNDTTTNSIILTIQLDSDNSKVLGANKVYGVKYILPDLPTTTANKTYVLKLVNGALTWVETE